MQTSLFTGHDQDIEHIPLIIAGQTVAALDFYPSVFAAQGQAWFEQLLAQIPWQQEQMAIAGKMIDIPRLQCWMGESYASYQYSGIALQPQPWLPVVLAIKQQVEQLCGQRFNSALINCYRHGQDSVSWHADDEAELGEKPIVASVSLGQTRQFLIKAQNKNHHYAADKGFQTSSENASSGALNLVLNNGSLLIMGAGVQEHYLHSVPKETDVNAARINLTFRKIITYSDHGYLP